MDVCIRVSRLHFAAGDQIDLASDSIVVFVGPNSSGKTQSLRDLWSILTPPNSFQRLSITRASLEKIGTNEQYLQFLQRISLIRDNSIRAPGIHISPHNALDNQWNRKDYEHIGPLFAKLIQADDRLSAIKERDRVDQTKEIAIHPLVALDYRASAENKISRSFNKIFGQHLMLDRGAGSVVNMHVGTRPKPTTGGGAYSLRYSSEVRKRPDINTEGDGLKAAAGLLLNVLSIPKCIYLIDEPDVYLHPPQAYAAAKELVEISADRQLFMATHNAHFVRGLLDANPERVIFVRLDRTKKDQSVNLIESSVFGEIESDPLVKFSNLLEAMFFRTAVVCENEADCLFYRNLCEVVDRSRRTDSAFWLSAHGKQNIRKFSRILHSLGLNVISIPDLDVVNNRSVLEALLESHGGSWQEIETDFARLHEFMASRKPTISTRDVKSTVRKVLNRMSASDDELFPQEAAEKIRDVLRGASPWREIKESGIKAFGRSESHLAAQGLLSGLEQRGILVPPVGEMESFYPSASGHGMGWVRQVLELDIENDQDLDEARKFARKIVAASK